MAQGGHDVGDSAFRWSIEQRPRQCDAGVCGAGASRSRDGSTTRWHRTPTLSHILSVITGGAARERWEEVHCIPPRTCEILQGCGTGSIPSRRATRAWSSAAPKKPLSQSWHPRARSLTDLHASGAILPRPNLVSAANIGCLQKAVDYLQRDTRDSSRTRSPITRHCCGMW